MYRVLALNRLVGGGLVSLRPADQMAANFTRGSRFLSSSRGLTARSSAFSNRHLFFKGSGKRVPTLSRAYSQNPQEGASKLSLLMKEYGKIAVVVYMGLTFIVFSGCYMSVVFFNVDASKLFKKVREWTQGMPTPFGEPGKTEEAVVEETEKSNSGFLSTLLLVLAMTKIFSPIKLMLTAGITPVVARQLKRLGYDVNNRTLTTFRRQSSKNV